MFTFMKKEKTEKDREEKERRKKEKREKKEQRSRDQNQLSPDELHRLEEVRRSLKKTTTFPPVSTSSASNKKLPRFPSGITADYRDTFNLENEDSSASGDQHISPPPRPTSLPPSNPPNPPPRPAKPPSRGILKGQNYNVARSVSSDLDDVAVLLKNTQANEAILYENTLKAQRLSMQLQQNKAAAAAASAGSQDSSSQDSPSSPQKSTISPGESADREVTYETAPATVRVRVHEDHVSPISPIKLVKLTVEELRSMTTGESIGVNQRPLSTDFSLRLPKLLAEVEQSNLEGVREVKCARKEKGSFGFVLKKAVLNKSGGRMRGAEEVILVEELDRELGEEMVFLPGDQLVEMCGVAVAGKTVEEVMEMIKGDSVWIKVRPIPEVSDLSRRILEEKSQQQNGLKRSDSQKFKIHKVHKGHRVKRLLASCMLRCFVHLSCRKLTRNC